MRRDDDWTPPTRTRDARGRIRIVHKAPPDLAAFYKKLTPAESDRLGKLRGKRWDAERERLRAKYEAKH